MRSIGAAEANGRSVKTKSRRLQKRLPGNKETVDVGTSTLSRLYGSYQKIITWREGQSIDINGQLR